MLPHWQSDCRMRWSRAASICLALGMLRFDGEGIVCMDRQDSVCFVACWEADGRPLRCSHAVLCSEEESMLRAEQDREYQEMVEADRRRQEEKQMVRGLCLLCVVAVV